MCQEKFHRVSSGTGPPLCKRHKRTSFSIDPWGRVWYYYAVSTDTNQPANPGQACVCHCGCSDSLRLGSPPRVKIEGTPEYAPVMELADMRDLGSRAAMRMGSRPFRRTKTAPVTDAVFLFMFP